MPFLGVHINFGGACHHMWFATSPHRRLQTWWLCLRLSCFLLVFTNQRGVRKWEFPHTSDSPHREIWEPYDISDEPWALAEFQLNQIGTVFKVIWA